MGSKIPSTLVETNGEPSGSANFSTGINNGFRLMKWVAIVECNPTSLGYPLDPDIYRLKECLCLFGTDMFAVSKPIIEQVYKVPQVERCYLVSNTVD